MTENASCQQFGVDAMMMGSGCFVRSSTVGADAATLHVVPEYAPHDDSGGSLFGLGGFSADVDDGAALAGQLQLAPQSVYGYGPSPSDVTVALPPAVAAKLAGDPDRGCWVQVQEQYYCPPAWLSGDPFTAAARELSLRLAAESSSTRGTGASLPDQSSDVSCSGVTHASSGLLFQQPPAYGVEQGPRPHFSEVLSRSGYAHIVQQTLDEFVGCLLQDVAGATDGTVVGEPSCCPLPSSSSSITTPSSYQSMMFPARKSILRITT
ncbi:hypothetical protein PR202_ga15149 [Eleusine coracana subsp. coracana]|uniref:Uncharacterized protein n=1 Tax=Eleusine coracana subsp. coracana TaxID=191504 RepID=A0AAV5CJI1_ELECO|nr:hypothetical protein PR202_ga15149 [Eleusine coracana subsp. coracana]